MIRRRVYRAGNSTVVGIPGFLLEEAGGKIGDYLEMIVSGPGVITATIRTTSYVEGRARIVKGEKDETG